MTTPAERVLEFLRQWKMSTTNGGVIHGCHMDSKAEFVELTTDDLEELCERALSTMEFEPVLDEPSGGPVPAMPPCPIYSWLDKVHGPVAATVEGDLVLFSVANTNEVGAFLNEEWMHVTAEPNNMRRQVDINYMSDSFGFVASRDQGVALILSRAATNVPTDLLRSEVLVTVRPTD